MNLDTPATVVTFESFSRTDVSAQPSGPDDQAYAKRILCEGDSWFSIGAIPSSNLLQELRFSQSTLLYSLARSGDTISNMGDISRNPNLEKLMREPNYATKWNAIFLSGGGNDLLQRAGQILCTPSPGAGAHLLDYVNGVELALVKTSIQNGYKRIAALRNGSINQDTPIITHVYDYATPRNSGARFLGIGFTGPWLYPALKQHDIPQEMWISLSDFLFEFIASTLVELSGVIDNFHVVSNTRDTLIRARLGTTGEDGDWLNEIHPTAAGYAKLAKVISPQLQQLL